MSKAYKDSGIPWIGMIPSDWEIVSVKNIFDIARGRVIATTELVDDGKYPVYSSQTKDNGCMGFINSFDYEKEALTWTTDGANAGTVFYRKGKFNCTNVCGILTPKSEILCNIHFLSYSVGFSTFFNKRADINGYKIMSNEMSSIKIVYPPLPTQQRIADFLDRKCAEIDELAALQETMIAELKRYKQSVITEAVTKGLNPNVQMKDSGVEWIGEIPEGWIVCRLKDEYTFKTGTTPKDFDKIIDDGNTVNWFTPTDIDEECNVLFTAKRKLHTSIIENEKIELYPIGSLIFVGIGASAGKIGFAQVKGYSNQQITALIPFSNICSKYTFYFLIADRKRIRDNAFFTTLPIINNGYLSTIQILLPPLTEQRAIADYLDRKCAEIDELIAIKQQKIEALKEYRKSVIFEYVTGKKEI